jgi:hypothetical protein
MFADNPNASAFEIVHYHLGIAFELDAFVVAAVHPSHDAFVDFSVYLRQVFTIHGHHEVN